MSLEKGLESQNGVYQKAIELASLVGTYLWKKNYKQILKKDFKNKKALRKGLQKIKSGTEEEVTIVLDGKEIVMDEGKIKDTMEQISNKIKGVFRNFSAPMNLNEMMEQQETNTGLEEIDLENLIDEDFSFDVVDRIRELYAQEDVRALYEAEIERRKESFESLEKGYRFINQLKTIDEIISKAKDKIMKIRIGAFEERRSVNPKENSLISKINTGIEQKTEEKNNLLSFQEIATSYRLETLRKYRDQLESRNYICTPTVQDIIEKVIYNILLGKNVLITGPTGTGKTVLAVEAVKQIAEKMNVEVTKISGKTLSEELEKGEAAQTLDDFVEVLSGHSGVTPSEFISKVRLKSDGKGGTETVSELGKILRAFVKGNIPIIDEIDLIPNDVLMRIKHLFTLKSGQSYAPQEDGNLRHILKSTAIIATANIKSDKHPDREDLDPAIVRLFKGVELGYLPEDEIYDIAVTSIMQKEGFIYNVGPKSLSDKRESVLFLLVKALKDIEDNYLGIGNGENISNKSKQFLRKAVLELGNFIGMFAGFRESGQELSTFIKKQVLEFVSNHAYPKTDRLILIKIFGSKGLITKEDVAYLNKVMSDISSEELDDNIISNDFNFAEDNVNFVDPYELTRLDPFQIRNIDDLIEKFKIPDLVFYLKDLDKEIMKDTSDEAEELADFIQDMLDKFEDILYEITEEEKTTLISLIHFAGRHKWVKKLGQEHEGYDEIIEDLKHMKILNLFKKMREDEKEFFEIEINKKEKKKIEKEFKKQVKAFKENPSHKLDTVDIINIGMLVGFNGGNMDAITKACPDFETAVDNLKYLEFVTTLKAMIRDNEYLSEDEKLAEFFDKFVEHTEQLISTYEETPVNDYKKDPAVQMGLLNVMYQAEMKEEIENLEINYPEFKDVITKLKYIDGTKGKKMFGEFEVEETNEEKEDRILTEIYKKAKKLGTKEGEELAVQLALYKNSLKNNPEEQDLNGVIIDIAKLMNSTNLHDEAQALNGIDDDFVSTVENYGNYGLLAFLLPLKENLGKSNNESKVKNTIEKIEKKFDTNEDYSPDNDDRMELLGVMYEEGLIEEILAMADVYLDFEDDVIKLIMIDSSTGFNKFDEVKENQNILDRFKNHINSLVN